MVKETPLTKVEPQVSRGAPSADALRATKTGLYAVVVPQRGLYGVYACGESGGERSPLRQDRFFPSFLPLPLTRTLTTASRRRDLRGPTTALPHSYVSPTPQVAFRGIRPLLYLFLSDITLVLEGKSIGQKKICPN